MEAGGFIGIERRAATSFLDDVSKPIAFQLPNQRPRISGRAATAQSLCRTVTVAHERDGHTAFLTNINSHLTTGDVSYVASSTTIGIKQARISRMTSYHA